ncbi:MAG: cupin domain-containing protein [Euryarchaeota archaeon]|nr:cupin domain-containing protein [Euryarchaeota archaeon]
MSMRPVKPPRPLCLKRRHLVTDEDARYLRGRVEILRPGDETGAHVTGGREEVIIVLEGTATVHHGKAKVRVREGHSLFIAEGVLHNVRNEGRRWLRYVYVRSRAKGEAPQH